VSHDLASSRYSFSSFLRLQLQHHTFVHTMKQHTLLHPSAQIFSSPNNSATRLSMAPINSPEGL